MFRPEALVVWGRADDKCEDVLMFCQHQDLGILSVISGKGREERGDEYHGRCGGERDCDLKMSILL